MSEVEREFEPGMTGTGTEQREAKAPERAASLPPYDHLPPYEEDEIRLLDIWEVLVARKRTIAAVTALFTVVAVAYALLLPRVYQASAFFLPPRIADIEEVNATDLIEFLPDEVFARFTANLTSRELRRTLFDEAGVLQALAPEGKEVSVDTVFERFNEAMTIEISKPAKGAAEAKPERVVLSLEGRDPEFLAATVNRFSSLANEATVNAILNDYRAVVASRSAAIAREISELQAIAAKQRADEIARIETEDEVERKNILDQIAALRDQARADRLAEIARLEEKDATKRAAIEAEIESLRTFARARREDQIKALTEAANVAASIGIKGRSALSPGSQGREGGGKSTIVTEITTQDQPLYLRGEDALRAEAKELESRPSDDAFIPKLRDLQEELARLARNERIEVLKARENDDPFIPALGELQQKLALLENNRTLEALKARESDAPYIKELRTLEAEHHRLENLSFSADKVRSATLDQFAYVPHRPVKPRRAVIAGVGFSLGLMASVFFAFFLAALDRERGRRDEQGEATP